MLSRKYGKNAVCAIQGPENKSARAFTVAVKREGNFQDHLFSSLFQQRTKMRKQITVEIVQKRRNEGGTGAIYFIEAIVLYCMVPYYISWYEKQWGEK